MIDNTILLANIRKLANLKGKSLTNIEDECNFGRSILNKWSTGDASLSRVLAVSDLFDISLDILIKYDLTELDDEDLTLLFKQGILSFRTASVKSTLKRMEYERKYKALDEARKRVADLEQEMYESGYLDETDVAYKSMEEREKNRARINERNAAFKKMTCERDCC